MRETQVYLIESMVHDGLLTPGQAAAARDHASINGCELLEALVATSEMDRRTLALAQAAACECVFVDLARYDISIDHAEYLPRATAERLGAFPLFVSNGVATIAMEDPLDLQAVDQLWHAIGAEIEPVVAEFGQVRALIERAYSLAGDRGSRKLTVQREEDDADLASGSDPVVAATEQVIKQAINAGASDVHINPDENRLHLRFRVDGVLVPQQGPSHQLHTQIVQRLKVMAKLDLTQTRRPQDGKFRFRHDSTVIDVRLSIIPTVHGENIVMRLLRPVGMIGSVRELGLPERVREDFEATIASPYGMLLVTGPTGSGKTTTLFTALAQLNTPDRNIITIEDPVEIRMPLLRQVQVNHEIQLGFAAVLRSVLRQDPDVVLVGEIRDEETARIAMQASMTGHLVLSTLHTNDAVGAISRLVDMGLPPFAINSGLKAVMAQRLVRKTCQSCAQPDRDAPGQVRALGLTPPRGAGFVRGTGCPSCVKTGYRGRVGIYELLTMQPEIAAGISDGVSESQLRELAFSAGLEPMIIDGLRKAALGETSAAELQRVCAVHQVSSPAARRAA